MLKKQEKRHRRHKKIRARILGAPKRPRLCVFRSNKNIYVQLIDDEKGKTLASASDLELDISRHKSKGAKPQLKNKESEEKKRVGKVASAYEAGKLIAKKTLEKKIEKVVFDKGGYQYHGRVKALAEGAREGGLIF